MIGVIFRLHELMAENLLNYKPKIFLDESIYEIKTTMKEYTKPGEN